MEKKAQLTLIIITAIIIVIAIIGIVFLGDYFKTPKYDSGVGTLQENLLNCFETSYKIALELNAVKGGFFNAPEKYFSENFSFIAYFYFEGESYFPTIEKIEEELSVNSKGLINDCINYYIEKNNSFNLESTGDYEVISKIEENQVKFKTDIKINVNYDNNSVLLDFSDYEIIIDSKLKQMYDFSEIIVKQAEENELEWIDLTEITEEAENKDLNITIIDINEEPSSYLFIIEDNKQENYPKKFRFLNKYKLDKIVFPEGFE